MYVCLFVCLFLNQSVCLSVCMFACMYVCIFFHAVCVAYLHTPQLFAHSCSLSCRALLHSRHCCAEVMHKLIKSLRERTTYACMPKLRFGLLQKLHSHRGLCKSSTEIVRLCVGTALDASAQPCISHNCCISRRCRSYADMCRVFEIPAFWCVSASGPLILLFLPMGLVGGRIFGESFSPPAFPPLLDRQGGEGQVRTGRESRHRGGGDRGVCDRTGPFCCMLGLRSLSGLQGDKVGVPGVYRAGYGYGEVQAAAPGGPEWDTGFEGERECVCVYMCVCVFCLFLVLHLHLSVFFT